MESIKFRNTAYELVANGYQLGDDGGKIIFRQGASGFEDVVADLKAMQTITMLDDAGVPVLTRSDLVYAGRLTNDDNYIIGADPEHGTDITGIVLIAEFRLPDVREELAAVKAQLDYVTMMTDIPMEG